MHKRLLVSALAAVLLCLLAGCQPTPEASVVVNKADGKLEAKISQTAKPEIRYEAPAEVNDTVTQNNVTVSIGADVIIPDVTAFPVFEVEPVGFTQEQVDTMGSVLLGDSKLFSISEGTQIYRTKEEVLDQIVREKARLEEVKQMGDEEFGIVYDGESREDVYARCEQSIKQYEDQYQTAPDVWGEDRLPATLALIKDGQREALKVYAQSGDFPCLYVSNGYEFGETTGFMLFEAKRCRHSTFAVNQGTPENVSVSGEDAIAQAEKLIHDLGIADMAVAYTGVIDSFYEGEIAAGKETEPCWGVGFERVMDGIPVSAVTASHAPDDLASLPDDNADYVPAFEPEILFVAVGDEGILGLQWSNVAEVTAKRSGNVELMPFNEVLERAKDNFFYKTYAQEDTKVEITINRIELSLMRIGKRDDKGTFLVVPVWDFIGNMNRDLPKGYEGLDNQLSFLTLNAIDGSMIDREKGY